MSMLDDNMLAAGSCIAGLGVWMTGLLALLFRNPDAPRWTRPEIVPMLVCVPVTVTTGLGLGYTAYGLAQLMNGTRGPRELLVLAGVLIVLALAWRALGIRRRLKNYTAAAGIAPRAYLAAEPTRAIDDTPPPPGPPPRSGHRAA